MHVKTINREVRLICWECLECETKLKTGARGSRRRINISFVFYEVLEHFCVLESDHSRCRERIFVKQAQKTNGEIPSERYRYS